ncbi:MAG TPA: iron-containing alcohol dehydrogenase, partial [Burkholderiaceae bacterium]|nr:iron-containing alcohol dehydrogenase [Burkholderiaceae bacterium]
MQISRFAFPTTIHFGAGARRLVNAQLRSARVRRPLLVTDRALAALPPAAQLRAQLEADFDVALFDGVHGNPTRAQAMAGAAAARAHRADAVIGFGGGAALDVAKVVAVLAVHDGDVLDYAWDAPNPRPIEQPLPYLVALPTTAGTGSEVGRSSVISEDDTRIKRIVFGAALLPREVFADPELTLGLPAAVTAATGMDAFTHNVESYLSPVFHPMCDGIGLEGVRIAAAALPVAVAEPGNLQARSQMMIASTMGAVAFQKDLGAVHS